MSDTKFRVLVLDDSEIVLNLMALSLTDAGFEVFAAGSLIEFEQLMDSADPHIVLTDIQMPDISGDEICTVLKRKMDTHLIPIILFSTIDQAELEAMAERSGADGFVSKDAGPEEIVNKINEIAEEIIF
jgi:CheY-like chemotaxis protein